MIKILMVSFTILILSACSERSLDNLAGAETISSNDDLKTSELVTIDVTFDGEFIIEHIFNGSPYLIDLSHPTLEQSIDDEWIIVDEFTMIDFEDESIVIESEEDKIFKLPFYFYNSQQGNLFRYSRLATITDSNELIYLNDHFTIK